MDRSAVTLRVLELAEPVALARGLEVYDVQYHPGAGGVVLRVLLDRPEGGGVTLDDLARFSRELGDVLDAHEAVPGRHHLECSSPGLSRPLRREPHFRRVLGQRVSVRTREPIAGRRGFHGTLESVSERGIVLQDPAVGPVEVDFAAIEKATTEFEFPRPAGAPARA